MTVTPLFQSPKKKEDRIQMKLGSVNWTSSPLFIRFHSYDRRQWSETNI